MHVVDGNRAGGAGGLAKGERGLIGGGGEMKDLLPPLNVLR